MGEEKLIDGGLITIGDAAGIAKRRGMAYVIVFGVQNDGDKFHIATWGTNKPRCKLAAVMGDEIGKAVLEGKVVTPQEEPYRGYDELRAASRPIAEVIKEAVSDVIDDTWNLDASTLLRLTLGQCRALLEAIAKAEGGVTGQYHVQA